MAVAILRENHAMSAMSRGESRWTTRAVGDRQSSGNSAEARSKNEYGSVNPGAGSGGDAGAPPEEEAPTRVDETRAGGRTTGARTARGSQGPTDIVPTIVPNASRARTSPGDGYGVGFVVVASSTTR